nr:hypothetical protein CFP56_16964 [Quercus suber]
MYQLSVLPYCRICPTQRIAQALSELAEGTSFWLPSHPEGLWDGAGDAGRVKGSVDGRVTGVAPSLGRSNCDLAASDCCFGEKVNGGHRALSRLLSTGLHTCLADNKANLAPTVCRQTIRLLCPSGFSHRVHVEQGREDTAAMAVCNAATDTLGTCIARTSLSCQEVARFFSAMQQQNEKPGTANADWRFGIIKVSMSYTV